MKIRPQVLLISLCLTTVCLLALYFGAYEVAAAAVMGLGTSITKLIEKD